MSRTELIKIIKYYQLDFRFSHWKEHLFMAEQKIYSDDFCDVLLDEARFDGEKIGESGNWLYRPPTVDELGNPDIDLGNLIELEQQRFGIKFLDRPRNCLILGGAGSGKTVCTRNICINVDKLNQKQKGNPTLLCIIDQKSDYAGDFKDNIIGETSIFSVIKNLKFGLNGPKNVPPYIWIGQVSISLAGRLGLITSRTCLTSIIATLLPLLNKGLNRKDLNDPSVSSDLIWPSLETILKITQEKKIMEIFSSKAVYSQSLSQSLEGLLQDSGELFNCCNGLDINDIFQKQRHCIIHTLNLPAYVTHIITDICINQVLVKRIAENYKTDHTDIIFVLDECDLLLGSDISNFPDLSPLDKLFRLGREMGVMSIVNISGI